MKGTIVHHRRGVATQYTNQFIVEIAAVKTKAEASKLMGKKAVWKTTSGKSIVGKVSHTHGGKGAVRVRFEKGLPGQAIGSTLEIEN